MRDYFIASVVIGSLPICFFRPWIGILMWSWLGYMNPHRLTWSFAYDMPWAQMVSIALLGGLILAATRKDIYPLPRYREVFFLFSLWFVYLISTFFAIYPEDAWSQFSKVSKIILFTFLTILLIQESRKLRLLTWVIVCSIGFYGFKGGIWAVRTGGQFILTGPADTFIEGNTNLGMALNMILPLVLFLRREETRPWVRHLLLTMFVLIIISIIMTYSRGALLGLFAVIFFLLLKSKAKLLLVPLIAFSIIFALNVLPGQWIEKMHTIETYEEDPSAISRIIAWEVGYRMALDRPFFGSGFASFTDEMYHKHLPGEKLEKAILGTGGHSIIFQTLAEHGFTGLIIYILLIFTTMLSLRNIIRRSKEDQKMRWIYNYAQMLEVSFIGFLVSGLFLSMQNFDLFYGLVAITIILKKLFLVQKVE